MLETTKYVRKTFHIDAVRVTPENIKEIAKWVSGELRSDADGQYVKVKVHRPANDRQTKAYAGDWVLYAGTGFKVYNHAAFNKSFEQVSGETVMIEVPDVEVDGDDVVASVEGDVVVPKRVPKKAAKSA